MDGKINVDNAMAMRHEMKSHQTTQVTTSWSQPDGHCAVGTAQENMVDESVFYPAALTHSYPLIVPYSAVRHQGTPLPLFIYAPQLVIEPMEPLLSPTISCVRFSPRYEMGVQFSPSWHLVSPADAGVWSAVSRIPTSHPQHIPVSFSSPPALPSPAQPSRSSASASPFTKAYLSNKKRFCTEVKTPKIEILKRHRKEKIKSNKSKRIGTQEAAGVSPSRNIKHYPRHDEPKFRKVHIQPRRSHPHPTNGKMFDAPSSKTLLELPKNKKRLALPCDEQHYTEPTCFLREHLLELFVAKFFKKEEFRPTPKTASLVRSNRTYFPGKIGLRCTSCANVPLHSNDRMPGSYFFPTSLQTLYRDVKKCQWQHINKCPKMSEEIKKKWESVREEWEKSKTNGDGAECWADSATKLGLKNETKDGKPQGIFFPK